MIHERPSILAHAKLEHYYLEAAPIELNAEDGGEDRIPTFSMVGYTGGVMRPAIRGMGTTIAAVVVDVSGITFQDKTPILRGHNSSQIVGHASISIEDGQVKAEGVVSGRGTAAADEVIALAKNGFAWQASIGISPTRYAEVPAGRTVQVNGNTFRGPVIVIRASQLKEISFVPSGADSKTSATIAAQPEQEGLMNFDQYVRSLGLDPATISAELRTTLEAQFERQNDPSKTGSGGSGGTDAAASPAQVREVCGAHTDIAISAIEGEWTLRDTQLAVMRREQQTSQVRTILANEPEDVQERAISERWTVEAAHLHVLRSNTPNAPSPGSSRGNDRGRGLPRPKVLAAAVCATLGMDEDELARDRNFGEQVVEASREFHGMGLRDLVVQCAMADGHEVRPFQRDLDPTIDAALSTSSLSSVVDTAMHRQAMEVYRTNPPAVLDFAAIGSNTDFKPSKRYRLLPTGRFESVGRDGELSQGTLDDVGYATELDTKGQVIKVSRQDIINDDLGLLGRLGTVMMMGAMASIDHEAAIKLLANLSNDGQTAFFSTANGNLGTGASSALGDKSMSKARELLRKQKVGPGTRAEDQIPVNITPRTFLGPPELERTALMLLRAETLVATGTGSSAATTPNVNIHRNSVNPSFMPHLSDSQYTGHSATAWYMFADPNVAPAIEVSFLNGARQPTLNRARLAAGRLGLAWEVYIDFGISMLDPNGAVKMTGVAA